MSETKLTATYLGLDIGTSGVKGVLLDVASNLIGDATAPLSVSRPQTGWSEQEPEDWWDACVGVIDALSKSHPEKLAALKAIGLSGQMHGATLLDKNHHVLRPAILWNDGRSSAECAQIEDICPASRQISGNIAMAGFTAPKILWTKNNEPEIFEKIAKVLLPKDYIRFRLSGEFVSEMSDASGTLWLDVEKRDWSDELLDATNLTRKHMPDLVEGSQVSAELSTSLKSRWNITGAVVIAGGGGDNAASACGIGAIRPAEGFVSLGTSGVLFVSNDKYRPNTKSAVHAFCHAIPDTWHQMGVILSATDSLNWLASITDKSPIELSGMVETDYTGPTDELFLPYLSGERTPHNNAMARGSFTGLSHSSTPTSMAQAVMEGVAFAFRNSQKALADSGTKIEQLIAVGGGSNSALWLKMIATNLNMEILVPQNGDFGGAFGAARLGICAATGADPKEICVAPEIRQVIQPDQDLAVAYNDQYQRFCAMYPAIEEVYS